MGAIGRKVRCHLAKGNRSQMTPHLKPEAPAVTTFADIVTKRDRAFEQSADGNIEDVKEPEAEHA